MTSERYQFDLIVIGSGIYGIQAARTYLEIHPNHRIVILEADACPGGAWGAHRMYENFWTQSPLGSVEFSDKPLVGVDWNETNVGFFQAKHFTKYLDEYLGSHIYDGTSLKERIALNTRVEKLTKDGDTWHAKTSSGINYASPKVIDVSGVISDPNIPIIPGAESFQGRILHHKDFGQSSIFKTVKKCVVVGGAKSAADVVYSYAKAGLDVSWVIRKTGNGPCTYFGPESPMKYYKNSNELVHTRLIASFAVSYWTPNSWWTAFLNRTRLGRWLVRGFWNNSQKDIEKFANYDRDDGKENGFSNLKPDTPLFWQNDSSGVTQRPDFFDTIAEKVKVYRQDIERIGMYDVNLADGTSIETDLIVFGTGWKHSASYIEPELAYSLGIATELSAEDAKEEEKWRALEVAADFNIVKHFPILTKPAPCYQPKQSETPFRLYNLILPIHDQSIAFLGRTVLANNNYSAEVQSLYAVAALDGKLQLPSETKMEEEVARVYAWMKRRYPAKGPLGHWIYFDIIPYTDVLLKQLDLSSHWAGWLKGFLKPVFAEDLRGLINEYKRKYVEGIKKKR